MMLLAHAPYIEFGATAGFQDVTFEKPIKGDLDRALSHLMHEARKKLAVAEEPHKDAMKQASSILLDFTERMALPPTEITGWARPHLENLGNVLLGRIPPNGSAFAHNTLRNSGNGLMACCAMSRLAT